MASTKDGALGTHIHDTVRVFRLCFGARPITLAYLMLGATELELPPDVQEKQFSVHENAQLEPARAEHATQRSEQRD